MTIQLEGGRIVRALPCFQSAPHDEQRRDRLRILADNELQLQSHTTRVQCYAEDPTKAVALELDGSSEAVLTVTMRQPTKQTYRTPLKELLDDNRVEFTGVFTSESFIIGRLVGPSEYQVSVRWQDRRAQTDTADWYYVRVTQHNGQVAWSSPIWVG